MAIRAAEHMFTGLTVPVASYDPAKTNLGQWIQQKTGAGETDKYAGPFPMSVARPMEASTAITCAYPHVIEIDADQHWVFLAELSAAGATRRIVLYRFTPSTQAWSWRGFILITYPPNTNHTIRGLRVVRHLHTAGTVSVSTTAVTGSSTDFQTARIGAGARIGFGSTNPANITTWYYISSIASDTGITLTSSAGSIGGGTAYVIEELRVYTSTTNATVANGGLFVVKGCNYDDFVPGGTTFAAATTADNIKAVYWLADASTVLNTIAAGLCLGDAAPTNTNHDLYVLNAESGTTVRVYKYNGRAALAGLASGKSTSAFVLRTGVQTTTGTTSQTNGSRIFTLDHGPGSGIPCMYFATTTRIYRAPESGIVDASTTFISDAMLEIPPGGANTFTAGGAMSSVENAGTIDRIIITTAANQRTYVTQYNSTSSPIDKVIFCNNNQNDQSTADSGLVGYPSSLLPFSVWVESGIAYFIRSTTSAVSNQIYAFPLTTDWDWVSSTGSRLISPEIATPNAIRYSRFSAFHENMIGSENLGLPPEPFRSYFRTSGIDDNSGSWTLIADTGNMSSIAGADSIQFMFEFKVAGHFCIPARLYGFVITYEDDSTDSHYQPSVQHSSTTSKRFAWRFSTAFGGTVPTLNIALYNAVTGALLLTDDTVASANGTFEKSTNDGGGWSAYNTTDKGNDTTYIRYTPTSLADNIKVRALLTQ